MNVLNRGLRVGACLLTIVTSQTFAENLYVYYPSTQKSNVVQQKIQGAAGDVTVTVFGKYSDFAMKATADKPDAVLVKGEKTQVLPGYTVAQTALRSGGTPEKYVLLSVDKALVPGELTAAMTIGVVDYNSREVMQGFVSAMIGKTAKIKNVTKVEDLLPLLTFQMAQGVIIAESDLAFFKSKSTQNLVTTPLKSFGNVAIVATKGAAGKSLQVAKKLTEIMPGFMGSVQWKN